MARLDSEVRRYLVTARLARKRGIWIPLPNLWTVEPALFSGAFFWFRARIPGHPELTVQLTRDGFVPEDQPPTRWFWWCDHTGGPTASSKGICKTLAEAKAELIAELRRRGVGDLP